MEKKETYDLVIVGAGPAGLALAQCVSHINKKILIIDRESSIGGCHRVRRVNGLFTEHGPRVYSTTYKVFGALLKEMGKEFTDLFTKYNFSIGEIGNQTVFTTLSYTELLKLSFEFLKLLINENHGINITMAEYLVNFKQDSIEIIDRLCKLTDGGGINKYTLNEFLQLFNQQFFYSLYQPKMPNDVGLFKIWKEFLSNRGIDFYLDTMVSYFNVNTNVNTKINSVILSNGKTIYANDFIMAIPPENLYKLTSDFKLKHNWGDLESFAKDTEYIEYISVAFHWNTNVNLKKVYGFPKSDWGVAFIVLSDYMMFSERDSKTVISAAVTISDKVSSYNKKTANQCDNEELIREVFRQLKESFKDLPEPTHALISPGNMYDKDEKKWDSRDAAFINTSKRGFLQFKNDIIPNMYTLGTHNGKSLYKFTSLESAVSNAVNLSKVLYPELKDERYIKVTKSVSLSDLTAIVIVILIVVVLIKVGKK